MSQVWNKLKICFEVTVSMHQLYNHLTICELCGKNVCLYRKTSLKSQYHSTDDFTFENLQQTHSKTVTVKNIIQGFNGYNLPTAFKSIFLTMSLVDGCAPRGWSCQEGRGGWRLKGQCWGHWGGATGDCWGVLLAETEDHHPLVEALISGCIWCLPQWSSTVAKKKAF